MTALLNTIDPDGLLEYSVVYTDRALNHMSLKFQKTMCDLSSLFKEIYTANTVIIVPGSGTFAMEAVARQLAQNKKCLTLRNGFFNFRWSQIFELGNIPAEEIVVKASAQNTHKNAPFAPAPLDEVYQKIRIHKPDLVFATHVETAAGIILPDEYIASIAQATHEYGGLFVLDCIASGATWINMQKLGVDITVLAPQKGWTSTPCAGIVLVNERAKKAIEQSQSDSFALDLKKWLSIMQAYENGSHAYHCTMPTDSLCQLRDTMMEAKSIGLDYLKTQQSQLGQIIRQLLIKNGFPSLAATGYEAPSVIVAYTDNTDIQSGKRFVDNGMQIAAGVPLKCDEPTDFKTFRIGLFGLDKLKDIDRTILLFTKTLEKVIQN